MSNEVKDIGARGQKNGSDHKVGERLNGDAKSLMGRWVLERWPVMRELWRSHIHRVEFLMSPEGGNMSMDAAYKLASGNWSYRIEDGVLTLIENTVSPEKKVNDELIGSLSMDVDNLSWSQMGHLFQNNPELAQQLWNELKDQALVDFETGHFAAQLFEQTEWQRDVWKRAHFAAIFQVMVESYEPRTALELQMVEIAAVEYFLWRHWIEIHLQRATTEPRRESYDYKEWAERNAEVTMYLRNGQKEKRKRQSHWTDGCWDVPHQAEADAIEQALEMADRCRRAYLASVRSLRDWRRYNVPVIVQNAEQVNIAGEGAQQTNVQKKNRRAKRAMEQERTARPSMRLADRR